MPYLVAALHHTEAFFRNIVTAYRRREKHGIVGGSSRIRTYGQWLKRPLLYRLSYGPLLRALHFALYAPGFQDLVHIATLDFFRINLSAQTTQREGQRSLATFLTINNEYHSLSEGYILSIVTTNSCCLSVTDSAISSTSLFDS